MNSGSNEESDKTKGKSLGHSSEPIKKLTDSLLNTTINEKYKLESLLGSGGAGIVFKAKHLIIEKYVAVKILLPGKQLDSRSYVRFQREAQTAMNLNHPNIGGVQDIGKHEDLTFIVMEYVDGYPLAHLPEDEILSLDEKTSILKQLCLALQYAHQNGIVHRDIKPENVIVFRNEQNNIKVKLIDFGIAKQLNNEEAMTLTSTGELFGTPAYMSPEQCMGLEATKQSDIYSLGCIAHEIYCGSAPYEGLSTLEMLNAHVQEDIPEFKRIASLIGIELVVKKALAKDPRQRFHSAKAMHDDILRVEEGKRPKHLPTGISKRKTKLLLKGMISLCCGILLIIVVLLNAFKPETFDSLSEKIRHNPKDVDALVKRGRLYNAEKLYRYAISDFNKALQLDPKSAMAYMGKSTAEIGLKDYDAALKDANKGIKLSPGVHQGYLARGILHREQKKYDEALDDLKKSIELNTAKNAKHNSLAYANLAAVQCALKQYEEAIDSANRAIKLNSKAPYPYLSRSTAYLGLNNNKKAIADCNKALTILPKSSQALYVRALANYREGKNEEALSDIDELMWIDPKYNAAISVKAYFRTKSGALDKARKLLKANLDFGPNDYYAYYVKAYLLYKDKKLDKAQKEIENAISIERTEEAIELKQQIKRGQASFSDNK